MHQDRLRVLIVQPHLSTYGGAETVVARLAGCLQKEGIEVAVMTLSLSRQLARLFRDTKFILPERRFVEKIRSVSFWRSVGVIGEILALRKMLRRHGHSYPVINVHNFPATWALVGTKKPVVWMCNEAPDLYCNPRPSLPLRLLRQLGIIIDRLIVNKYVPAICVADQYNAARVFQRYGRQGEVVNYGIDYDFFDKYNPKEGLDGYNLSDSYVLLHVGVLSPEKNQLASIRAVAALKDVIPSLKLVLAGKGTGVYEEKLRRYVSQNNLSDRVIFTGHLSKEKVRALYHLCSVALFPVKSQGGWLSPFEALSAGKPIIVSPSMGAAALIRRENIGVVTDNFTAAIKDIYSRPDVYQEWAQRGKRWVAENLTWETFTDKMLAVFKKALG